MIEVVGNVMLLAALLVQADPSTSPLHKIIADLHLQNRADAGEAVSHGADQRPVAQAHEVGVIRCDTVFGGRPHDRDAVEQRAGFVCGDDRGFALFHDIFRSAHGVGRIDVDDMARNEPVEQHAERRQVLLDGRRRNFGLQILDESGDMERLDAGKIIEIFLRAPGGETPGGVHIGPAGMIVVDLAGEDSRTRFAAFGVGVKSGAGRRSGEGTLSHSKTEREGIVLMARCYGYGTPASRVGEGKRVEDRQLNLFGQQLFYSIGGIG
jgi:hypothetical protein